MRYGVILCVFCTMIGALWANPFTGKKDTPAPIRKEKPADFMVNRQAQLHTIRRRPFGQLSRLRSFME